LLTESTVKLLEDNGFTILINVWIPCNDGGLSFGQIIETAATLG